MKGKPILLNLLFLVFSVGSLAWAASFALVLLVPRTPDRGASVGEVLQVLKGKAEPEDYGLKTRQSETPPIGRSASSIALIIERKLRGELVDERDIRVDFRGFMLPGARQGGTQRGGQVQVSAGFDDLNVRLFRGTYAIQLQDGTWTVVEDVPPLISSWHLKILTGYFSFALLLLPIAYFVARRLSAPMRDVAHWVECAELAEGASTPLVGPRELRQIAAAIAEMRVRLQQQIEEKTIMLAAVAHDFRTPLTALRLRCESTAPPLRDRMVADIARLEAMVDQFLAFTRGAGRDRYETDVDFAQLLRSVVNEAGQEKRLVLIDAPPQGLFLRGDPLDLRRMFDNLVDNALRYGGGAEITLGADGECAVLIVADRGPGLPESELERVFQPFYRPDMSRNSETGGSGLGLAIVRAIARAHGGDATVRNRPGRGLEAEVRLPLSRD